MPTTRRIRHVEVLLPNEIGREELVVITDDLGGRVVSLGFARTDCPRRWSQFRLVELSES